MLACEKWTIDIDGKREVEYEVIIFYILIVRIFSIKIR